LLQTSAASARATSAALAVGRNHTSSPCERERVVDRPWSITIFPFLVIIQAVTITRRIRAPRTRNKKKDRYVWGAVSRRVGPASEPPARQSTEVRRFCTRTVAQPPRRSTNQLLAWNQYCIAFLGCTSSLSSSSHAPPAAPAFAATSFFVVGSTKRAA